MRPSTCNKLLLPMKCSAGPKRLNDICFFFTFERCIYIVCFRSDSAMRQSHSVYKTNADASDVNKTNSTAGPREFRQICREKPMSLHNFYCKCITRKCLILKIKFKVMKYSIRNNVILRQILKSIKDITHSLLAFKISEIFFL